MTRHRTTAELEGHESVLRESPRDGGTLELVVCRPGLKERRVLDEGHLDLEVGLVGDSWKDRPSSKMDHEAPHPRMQLNVMNHRMVALLAGDDPERQALAGDQLYVDLDLSEDNLPTGTRLALGTAVIEVTEIPHRGCAKFMARFGEDAMRFVNGKLGRELRLRGINAIVVVPGTVRAGDVVKKV